LLMLEQNTITRHFFDNFINENGVKITPEIELGSVDLLIEPAKIGLGISFVTRDYVEKELADNTVFELKMKEEIPPRSLGIVTNNNIPTSVAAQKFMILLQPEEGI